MLSRADRLSALGELIAGITHEIKNSLGLMTNFAEVGSDLARELRSVVEPLASGLAPSARRDLDELLATLVDNLATIGEHGHRADGIVRSVLLSTRGRSAPARTELNRLVEESLALARFGTHARSPAFRATTRQQLDPAAGHAEIDAQEINRVLLNLFSNAYQALRRRQAEAAAAGEAYEPTLTVRTEGLDDRVRVRVHDNGTGVAESDRERIFSRFFTTSPPGEGSGLGLALCLGIVQRHGGQLSVRSEAGVYAEFSLELPRSAVAAHGEPA